MKELLVVEKNLPKPRFDLLGHFILVLNYKDKEDALFLCLRNKAGTLKWIFIARGD